MIIREKKNKDADEYFHVSSSPAGLDVSILLFVCLKSKRRKVIPGNEKCVLSNSVSWLSRSRSQLWFDMRRGGGGAVWLYSIYGDRNDGWPG